MKGINHMGGPLEKGNSFSTKKVFGNKRILYPLLLILIVSCAFLPCFSLGFVEWDDPVNLLENENLKPFADDWSWQAVKSIFTSDVNGNYNPLPILAFAIERHFFAPGITENPFIFHFNNVWLHIACTLCVFVIFIRLGAGNTAAFIGALLFGIHPMRVESVAWVTERKDVLYGLFYLLSIITYLKYARANNNKMRWYTLTIVISLFSYFSKIQAVALPLSMVAIDFYLGRKWASVKILILEKLPWWLLSAAFGFVNLYFLNRTAYKDSGEHIYNYSFIQKLAVGAYTYMVYIVKWVYPYKLVHYYASPAQLPIMAYVALAAVPVGAVLLYIWARRKQLNYVLFGWAFFTVNVMFLLQVFPVGKAYLADRFTYIGYFGLFFIAAKLYEQFVEKYPASKKAAEGAVTAYLLLFCFMSYAQAKTWQNTETLWANYNRHNPDDYFGYHQLGIYYLAQLSEANTQENERYVQLALENLMEADMKDSLAKRPSAPASALIYDNLGIAYGVTGDHEKALHYFTREIITTPDSIDGYTNRGFQYFSHQQYELAIKDYTDMIRLNPHNAHTYYSRANAYFSLKNYAAALPDLNEAISLDGNEPKFHIARAMCLRALNDVGAAKKDALHAQQMGGDVPAQLLQ
jgi:tetratricopeptide (TPR) repeat protein